MFVPCGDVEVQEPQPESTWDRCGSGQPMRLTAVKSTRGWVLCGGCFCKGWDSSLCLVVILVDIAVDACAWQEARRKLEATANRYQSENSRLVLAGSFSFVYLYVYICLWAKRTRLVTSGLPDFGLLLDRDRLGLVPWTPWTIIIKQ